MFFRENTGKTFLYKYSTNGKIFVKTVHSRLQCTGLYKHTGKTIFLYKCTRGKDDFRKVHSRKQCTDLKVFLEGSGVLYTVKSLITQEKRGFFINGKYTGRKAMSGT